MTAPRPLFPQVFVMKVVLTSYGFPSALVLGLAQVSARIEPALLSEGCVVAPHLFGHRRSGACFLAHSELTSHSLLPLPNHTDCSSC